MQAVIQRQIAFISTVLTHYTGAAPADLRVLDWGCGKGQIAYLLRQLGFSVTACDRDDDSDDSSFGQDTPIIAEHKINVIPLEDPVRLPFETASFDCVTSFGVLEHVPQDRASLREIRRILKPGGLFYVTFLPYRLSWTQAVVRLRGNHYHDRLYWRRSLLELARDAGFTVQSLWFGQLFPKHSIPLALDPLLEPLDRMLCRYTPFKYIATNLESILIPE
jgi:SAM-dependent methyltransferase